LGSFTALIQIVTGACGSDEDGEQQFSLVTSFFGTKLAYAAVRKKLRLPSYDSKLTEIVDESAAQDERSRNQALHQGTSDNRPSHNHSNALDSELPSTDISNALTINPLMQPDLCEDASLRLSAPEAASQEIQAVNEVVTDLPRAVPAESPAAESATETTIDLVRVGFSITAGETAQTLAASLIRSGTEPRWDQWSRLAWLCLRERNLGVAFRLFHIVEKLCPEERGIHSSVVRALAIAAHISQPAGSIAQLLKQDIETFKAPDHHSASSFDRAECMLMIASLLRPSLVAPELHAADYLRALGMQLGETAFYRLFERMSEYCANTHTPLDPIALKYLNDKSRWKLDCEKLKSEVEGWWIRVPQLQFSFQAAQRVWREWLQPGNYIDALLAPIRSNGPQDLTELQRMIDKLSNDSRLHTEIDITDRQLRKHGSGKGINTPSYQVLRRHVREAVAFASRWLELQKARSHRDDSYHSSQLQKLRSELEPMIQAIHSGLSRQRSFAPDDLCLQSALDRVDDSFARFLKMLSHGEEEYDGERPIRHILNADLLRIPGIELDDEWNPVNCDETVLAHKLVEYVADNDKFSWKAALAARENEDRDHVATEHIIAFLDTQKLEPPLAIEELRRKRLRHLSLCRDALQRETESVQKEVEHDAAFGLLTETQRARHLDTIRSIEESRPSLLRFKPESARIKDLQAELRESRVAASELVREKMKSAGLDPNGSESKRINVALGGGDILCANEYLDLIRQGQPLPAESDERDIFREFFPDILNEIQKSFAENQPLGVLINRIEHGKVFAGIKFASVPEDQRADTIDLINAWYTLKRNKQIGPHKKLLETLLKHLGFKVEELTDSFSLHRAWLQMKTSIISDRRWCPVPFFGSQANGSYRLFCIWDRPSEEQIAVEAGRAHEGSPVIVIYFGRMNEDGRRHLAQICRTERKSFLLIDETLTIFLCGERGTRLPALFQCTLPFTHVNPYSTTASLVPPEMFYGRRAELFFRVDVRHR